MRRPGPSTIAIAALLLVALPPALAGADFESLYREYRQTGLIAGCAHTEEDLQTALANVPADIKAYDPGFADALNGALEQRAGDCSGAVAAVPGASTGSGIAEAPDGSPGPATPRAPLEAPLPRDEEDVGLPTALALLIGAVAVALLAALALLAAAHAGWSPDRALRAAGRPFRAVRDWLADGLWAVRDRLGR